MSTSRSGWRPAIRKGTEAFENERQSSQQVKRAAMKARTITAERPTKCPVCSRLCALDFGLRSHMREHKQRARLDYIDHDSRPYIGLRVSVIPQKMTNSMMLIYAPYVS